VNSNESDNFQKQRNIQTKFLVTFTMHQESIKDTNRATRHGGLECGQFSPKKCNTESFHN